MFEFESSLSRWPGYMVNLLLEGFIYHTGGHPPLRDYLDIQTPISISHFFPLRKKKKKEQKKRNDTALSKGISSDKDILWLN